MSITVVGVDQSGEHSCWWDRWW